MTRTVEEWRGKTDDTPVPDRVRLRVLATHDHRCHVCRRRIRAGEYWECDHVTALINGGENRERNLAPACCNCCKPKTAEDVAEKSAVYRKASKHFLPRDARKRKLRSRNTFRPYEANVRDVNEDRG